MSTSKKRSVLTRRAKNKPKPLERQPKMKTTKSRLETQGVHYRLIPVLLKWKISFSQYFLLCHLTATEHKTMTELSREMGCSTAAITSIIDKLEGLEYVTRVHDDNDRRKIFVHVTSKGRQFLASIEEKITGFLQEEATCQSRLVA